MGHVCWVVDDDRRYIESASTMLADGAAEGRKTVAFGPRGSDVLIALADRAVMTADPAVDVLEGGPLRPEAMFSMFRSQAEQADAEGYAGLCVVADMDWMLSLSPPLASVVGFEALLDEVVAELGATVVCAYRRATFTDDLIEGTRCVHPLETGVHDQPPFRLVAAALGEWRLTGEVDVACADAFAAGLHAVAAGRTVGLDIGGLDFIDVAGLRELARARDGRLVLRRPSDAFRRIWALAQFEAVTPWVELA